MAPGEARIPKGIMNIEQGIMNIEVARSEFFPSSFEISCSMFDIIFSKVIDNSLWDNFPLHHLIFLFPIQKDFFKETITQCSQRNRDYEGKNRHYHGILKWRL